MAKKFLLKSWGKAAKTADKLMKRLKVAERHSRCTSTRVNGKKRRGWRVTCTRLSDGKTATKFVAD
jgi:hypothetical protein